MQKKLAVIGFGEAAQAFAPALLWPLMPYDRKTDAPDTRAAKIDDYGRAGVDWAASSAKALTGARAALSLVTADQAFAAAEAAISLAPGTFWFDMNSVAPGTKRAAAALIEHRGGCYVDVAVMAPVYPARTDVPLLLSGPFARQGADILQELGFSAVRVVAGDIGAASSIKMIRSVMVKGIEALTAECALAAEAAGVRDEVIASLDASWSGDAWSERFDYNLDRMMAHGTRRAAEMDEVVATLDMLGTASVMSRGAAAAQRAIGGLELDPPQGLDAKLAALLAELRRLVS